MASAASGWRHNLQSSDESWPGSHGHPITGHGATTFPHRDVGRECLLIEVAGSSPAMTPSESGTNCARDGGRGEIRLGSRPASAGGVCDEGIRTVRSQRPGRPRHRRVERARAALCRGAGGERRRGRAGCPAQGPHRRAPGEDRGGRRPGAGDRSRRARCAPRCGAPSMPPRPRSAPSPSSSTMPASPIRPAPSSCPRRNGGA